MVALRVVRVRKEPAHHAQVTCSASATPTAARDGNRSTALAPMPVLDFPIPGESYPPVHTSDTTSTSPL
jgi:hypothetical protein